VKPDDISRELLDQAEHALNSVALSLLGIKPWLDKPYTDAPQLTPWDNGIGRQARRAHDLGMAIRKHLGLPHRWRTTAIGTMPLTTNDAIPAEFLAAAKRAAHEATEMDIGSPRAWTTSPYEAIDQGVEAAAPVIAAAMAGRIAELEQQLARVREIADALGDRTDEPVVDGRPTDRRLMAPLRRMLLAILDGTDG